MLNETSNAGWVESGVFRRRHQFAHGGGRGLPISTATLEEILREQMNEPVMVSRFAGYRQYWLYRNHTYWDEEGLDEEDVRALVLVKEKRKARQLQIAHQELGLEGKPPARRPGITREMRRAVWERDGGKCTECGSGFDLQFDHIVPFSLGGATTVENLRLACSECNQKRGNML